MSDDAKKDDAKKDGKDAKHAEAAPGKKNGMVPVIAGAVVVALIGAGGGMYVVKSLAPAPVEKPAEHAAGGDGHGGDAADPHAADPHAADGGLLAKGAELPPITLKGNVTGSGGTRYVTMSVGVWVPKHESEKFKDDSVKRLIQSRLEELVKTYQLDELNSPNISARMKKEFGAAVERLLNSIEPNPKPEEKRVLEITIIDLITQ